MTTANEIFDVVNERDEVVGQETRLEVHKRGLLHRAVHVLIFNGRGQLFLQKRSLQKDCFPGTWDSSAAGHLAPGEAYDACAVREVQEELGLELSCAPLRLFKIDACAATGQEFVWVYRHEAEGPFLLDPVEIDRGDWFAPDSIDRWIAEAPHEFADAFRLIWQILRALGPSPGAAQPRSCA
jgi:isopentenyl-diphosphate Delta-isomerase